MKRIRFILAATMLCTLTAHAGFHTANSATRKVSPRQWADAYLRTGSAPSAHGQTTLRAYPISARAVASPVFVFVLPELNGEKISTARLSLYGTPNLPNNVYNTALDLYAVRYVAQSGSKADTEVLASDEARRPTYAMRGNNGTGIMNNFFPKSHAASLPGIYTTSDEAGRSLGAWLQAQYTQGAKAGDYVFFRLTPDAAPSPTNANHGWIITARDDVSNPAHQPALTIITKTGSGPAQSFAKVKPPSAQKPKTPIEISLLGVGMLLLVLLRREKSTPS